MRRKKQISEPIWLIWEGEDFPRKIHSDSIVMYLCEHIYLEDDDAAKRSLAKSLLREGISTSLSDSYNLINSGWVSRDGFRYDDGDERFPIYCDNDDPELDFDATYVEIAYVD